MASGDRIARAFAERRFALGDEEQPVTMRFVSERPSENFERRARISAASPSSLSRRDTYGGVARHRHDLPHDGDRLGFEAFQTSQEGASRPSTSRRWRQQAYQTRASH